MPVTIHAMAESDQILLGRMAKGDHGAFQDIYNKYAENLFVYAMSIFNHRETCEDILQNVFVHLWEKRNNNITHLKPYLYQAVKFQIIKTFRDTKITNSDIVRMNLVDTEQNASRKMEFKELESYIECLVLNLSPRCRQIFIMSRFENKSNMEISQELGLSIQSVKNQLTLATNKLRNQISPNEFVLYQIAVLILLH